MTDRLSNLRISEVFVSWLLPLKQTFISSQKSYVGSATGRLWPSLPTTCSLLSYRPFLFLAKCKKFGAILVYVMGVGSRGGVLAQNPQVYWNVSSIETKKDQIKMLLKCVLFICLKLFPRRCYKKQNKENVASSAKQHVAEPTNST